MRFKKVSAQANKGILSQDEFERSESLLCYFPSAQVPHNINFREKKSKLKKDKKSESGATEESAAAKSRIARFRYFEDISGYSGVRNFFYIQILELNKYSLISLINVHISSLSQVFICGPSPHWMLVTSRGAMRLHPMSIDGSIESFSPFHNINCPKGFLYFNKQVHRGHTVTLVLVAYLFVCHSKGKQKIAYF